MWDLKGSYAEQRRCRAFAWALIEATGSETSLRLEISLQCDYVGVAEAEVAAHKLRQGINTFA